MLKILFLALVLPVAISCKKDVAPMSPPQVNAATTSPTGTDCDKTPAAVEDPSKAPTTDPMNNALQGAKSGCELK